MKIFPNVSRLKSSRSYGYNFTINIGHSEYSLNYNELDPNHYFIYPTDEEDKDIVCSYLRKENIHHNIKSVNFGKVIHYVIIIHKVNIYTHD